MAITHLSLVNQKLAYARVILGLLAADEGSHLQQQALIDSCVFHMISAYRFYLRELAENYRVKNVGLIQDIGQLENALSAIDKAPSEASELAALEADRHSWLRQLLDHFGSLQESPVAVREAKAFVTDTLIQAVDVTDTVVDVKKLAADELTTTLDSFRQLIQRQRETSAEY